MSAKQDMVDSIKHGTTDKIAKSKLKSKEAEYDGKLKQLIAERDKVQDQINRTVAYVNQVNASISALQGGKQVLADLLADTVEPKKSETNVN